MKRSNLIIIATALALGTATLRAQEHLVFEKTPITGDVYTFCTRLAIQGYRLETTRHNASETQATLTARRGNDTVEVLVSDEGTNNVQYVLLSYPVYRQWDKLLESYTRMRSHLTTTYGQPREDIMPEKAPAMPFEDIADGSAQYKAVYTTRNGTVTIMIMPEKKHARIVINYRDGINPIQH